MLPNTADSAAKISGSDSCNRPPASARNQKRRQPRTEGGRSSAWAEAPPIQRGVTASNSTSSDFRAGMMSLALFTPSRRVTRPSERLNAPASAGTARARA